MYLQNVTITGFKSFAKRSDLEFPSTVTAIVGPNGSGKSNVAEALRFVLGEQSVKSLRGKRGEDLIWGGSEAVSRANRASVLITLNNEQKVLPLDTDTVTVERVVHRDGQNEYKLNNRSVRLKDVHELLAAGNIGPSGHHIISQGEADRVLSATPDERRAMIEDALGLKVYQYKKSDAEKKLAKTQQNIGEVNNLRKELAPHLTYLQKELDKQAEAKALRIELHDAYAEYLKREDVYLAHQYDTLTAEQRKISDEIQTVEAAIAKIEADTPAETTADETLYDVSEEQETLTHLRKKRESLSEQYNRVAGKSAALAEQLAVLQEEPDEVMVPLHELQDRVAAAESELATAKKSTEVHDVFSAFTAAITRFRELVANWTGEPKADKRQQVESQLEELRSEEKQLAHELDELKQEEQAAQKTYDEKVQARDAARVAQQSATKELYEQKTALSELHTKQRRYEHELEIIARERQAFKDELQEAVALLGRGAAQYFKETVSDADGNPIDNATVIEEPREEQRARKRALEKLKIRLETLGEGESETLEEEYKTTKERDDFLARELTDLEESVTALETLINDLSEQIDEQFQAGFGKIQTEFQNFFSLMFGGGKAELQIVQREKAEDSDVEEGAGEEVVAPARGIDLSVQLPNKRIQGLAMLSGGERALTSIALIFAMSQVHPPLFIVLDETDAALDEANSRRYGDLIEALAQRSQLILITHNRETMSRAGTLYGVTMTSTGVSKLLSVQLDEAVVNAK